MKRLEHLFRDHSMGRLVGVRVEDTGVGIERIQRLGQVYHLKTVIHRYFYRGEALNQLSRIDEALDMLLRATQIQPANARAYYVMGILYDKKSRPQEAAAMYRKAREAGSA